MKNLRRGHTSRGSSQIFSGERIFSTRFCNTSFWYRMRSVGETGQIFIQVPDPPGHGEQRRWGNFILFPLLALGLVQGQRRQDWRDNFSDLLPASPSFFFVFRCKSSCFWRWSLKLCFPWQISTHFGMWKLQTKIFHKGWPSNPVDLQDSFELDLEFTLRSCSSTEWEFWKSMRWGCGSRRGELLSDANVAGTKEWLSYKLETRWLVVGFQREFFVLVLSLLASSPNKNGRKWAYSCCLP